MHRLHHFAVPEKKPEIVLILEIIKDKKYWIRLKTTIEHFNLPIDIWTVGSEAIGRYQKSSTSSKLLTEKLKTFSHKLFRLRADKENQRIYHPRKRTPISIGI
jgi:hypothetical protein